jgi:hypothetical protein
VRASAERRRAWTTTAIMRQRLMNRTTLDVLLVVLLLAWAIQPLAF